MKSRCAGLSTLLLLLGATGIAYSGYDFHGVLHTINTTITIDSAYLIVPPDSLAYPTTGWSAAEGKTTPSISPIASAHGRREYGL